MPTNMEEVVGLAPSQATAPHPHSSQLSMDPSAAAHPMTTTSAVPTPPSTSSGIDPSTATAATMGTGQQEVTPTERDRSDPNSMIGKRVRVFWPVDGQWYIGEVLQYDPTTGEHLLKYEDDDTEWIQLGESNTTVDSLPPSSAPAQGGENATENNGTPAPGTAAQQQQQQPGGMTLANAHDAAAGAALLDAIPPISPAPGHLLDQRLDSPRTFPPSLMLAAGGGNGSAGVGGPPGTLMGGGIDPSGLIPPGSSSSVVSPDDKWEAQQQQRQQQQQQDPRVSQLQGFPPPPMSSSASLHQHNFQAPPPGYGPPPPGGMYGNFGPPPPHGYGGGGGPGRPGGYPYGPGGGMPPPPFPPHMEDLAPPGGLKPPHTGFHSLGIRGGTPSPAPTSSSLPGGGGPVITTTAGIGIITSSAGGKRKNGPKAWSKEEDALLLSIVQSMRMPMKWSVVAQRLPERTGKQCRERYVNHLNPRLKVTDWTPVEDATIFHLYNTIGSHWAKMSKIIPGRTDNGIKNRFHNLRRQLEREDEHRIRLSAARDFPKEIRLDLIRDFPEELRGKSAELWDIKSGLSILAAQSVLGGGVSRNAGRFGPFRSAEDGDVCVRCGFMLPSIQTGNEICTKTGWCQSCTRIPPHLTGAMLRECLNLRRCQEDEPRRIIESWESGKMDFTTTQ